MRVGITGASGFIGAHLARALAATGQHQIEHFQRPGGNLGRAAFAAFVRGKELIYHLAGVNRGSEEELFAGNANFTFSLLQAVKDSGGKPRLVFASSSQVYAPRPKPIRESQPPCPATLYGVAKRTAEELIRISGLPHTILRLSNVYGPGCRPDYNSVIATFCHRARKGETLSINGDGRQGRDFIYIEDAVRAFLAAADARVRSGIFNVSSGKITALRQILRVIEEEAPGVKIEFNPGAGVGGLSYCCDNTRFVKQYAWKPRVSPRAGIRQTLRAAGAS